MKMWYRDLASAIMSTNRCQHQATQSTSFQQVCASEINIIFETLTGFTCSAVYDTATSTTLPPVSSPSPVDGGTPTPIVQECTTISVLPQVPTSADATTLPISTPPGCRLLFQHRRYTEQKRIIWTSWWWWNNHIWFDVFFSDKSSHAGQWNDFLSCK